jgi:hypothetical protein
MSDLKPDQSSSDPPGGSASLPSGLLRRGWVPYRFPNSDVMVVLPRPKAAQFNEKGALFALFTKGEVDFTATLHSNPVFTKQRERALEFVASLAKKKNATPVDVATYRYFADPKVGGEGSREHHFWVIGIPGAVVVVSLTRDVGSEFPPAMEEIRLAIPRIIGEVL